jgi:hypothetical protein
MHVLQAKETLIANTSIPFPAQSGLQPVTLPQYSEILGAFLFGHGFEEDTGFRGRLLPEQKLLVANGALETRTLPRGKAAVTETYITVDGLDHFSIMGALALCLS